MGYLARVVGAWLVIVCHPLLVTAEEALAPFPAPEAGMARLVITLPALEHEAQRFKVELMPGRVLPTDGVNAVSLDVHLERHNLEGWGYPWYKLVGSGQMASTMMAAPAGALRPAFVAGAPLMVRYNHRLPIVIYVPVGYTVRYRVWRADDVWREAEAR